MAGIGGNKVGAVETMMVYGPSHSIDCQASLQDRSQTSVRRREGDISTWSRNVEEIILGGDSRS